jgi:hypothetical protein
MGKTQANGAYAPNKRMPGAKNCDTATKQPATKANPKGRDTHSK